MSIFTVPLSLSCACCGIIFVITNSEKIEQQLSHVDGVMMGRVISTNPCLMASFDMLHDKYSSSSNTCDKKAVVVTRRQVLQQYSAFVNHYLIEVYIHILRIIYNTYIITEIDIKPDMTRCSTFLTLQLYIFLAEPVQLFYCRTSAAVG